MKNTELLNKLVEAFHDEIDWETKENIESGIYNCLPIIEEHCKDFIKNCDLPIVNGSKKKKIKMFDSIEMFEEFVNTDIEILQMDLKAVEQSYRFQECFCAVVYYR
tara:strand:- start:383 stop:700 length:318 start_codon:yes stop_codon:yes gene_type:complete